MTAKTNPVVFIRKGFVTWSIAIPSSESVVRHQLNSSTIDFKHDASSGMANPKCTFATADKSVISFLTKWSKENPGKIKTDMSAMPLKCHLCDFSTKGGTSADMETLRQHLLEAHPEIVDEANGVEEVTTPAALNPDDFKLAELKELAIEQGVSAEEVEPLRSKAEVIALIEGAG